MNIGLDEQCRALLNALAVRESSPPARKEKYLNLILHARTSAFIFRVFFFFVLALIKP